MDIQRGRRRLTAREGDFELLAERELLGSGWTVRATSPIPGERMTLYATSGVVHHGYWRDLLVGDDEFDRRHFVYSDNPALLPLAVGPETRAAIAAAGPTLALHVHRGRVQTEERAFGPDEALARRHHAVHAAFAADHARAIERWKRFAEILEGRVLAKWPPVLLLGRPIGAIVVSLTWRIPQSSDSAEWASAGESLTTELLAERGQPGPAWRLDRGLATIGAHQRIGDRHFEVVGKPTLSHDALAHAVRQANIVAIRVDREVVVQLGGMVGDRPRLDAAIELMTRIVAPGGFHDSPYR